MATMFYTFLILALAVAVECNPTGAPATACNDMLPQHGQSPQSIAFPGSIQVNRERFSASDEVTVVVSRYAFRGIFLQARLVDSATVVRVGEWISVPAGFHLVQCQGSDGGGTGVTHSNRNEKLGGVFTWRAPLTGLPANTRVVFLFTVVVDYRTYWVQLRSLTLTSTSTSALTPTIPTPPQPTQGLSPALQYVDFQGCAQNMKSCFYYNAGDSSQSSCYNGCDYKLSITMDQPVAGYLRVDMVGRRHGWLGVGFSDDEHMGRDDVYVCIDSNLTPTFPRLERYWNPAGHSPSVEEVTNPAILDSTKTPGYVDGYVRCSFYRLVTPNNLTYPNVMDLSRPLHVMFTYGTVGTNGQLRRHVPDHPARTSAPVTLRSRPVSLNIRPSDSSTSSTANIVIVSCMALVTVAISLLAESV